ncbi:MAG: hypothetical protein GY939_08585 [Actinomycetia bacterium]|nr:hypothetical protein [Actinomycetes bacterium]
MHDIDITFDTDAYDEMIVTYETSGEKDWIDATITIDGTTFVDVGVRLKGNSSLFSVTSETAGNPEDLPWLIKLDKYVDDQNYQGYRDLVIRSNSTETAMNEAVALELLGLAGLATEEGIATSFTVNGGDTELRLAIEHPDEVWEDDNFDADEAVLYKADSEGDYTYRGDDEEAYTEVFDIKAGEDDYEPLIDFLDFVNNSDDATFAADLGDWLDIDSFATYLAFQDLIANADDIDGRGNNSYLHYDYDSQQFTVVAWDHNLAFNTANVAGGPGAGPGGVGPGGIGPGAAGLDGATGERPAPPEGGPEAGAGGPGAGGLGGGGSNVLASRFLANDTFEAMVDEATVELTETLYRSGAADDIVETWVSVLTADAAGLVDAATIEAEAEAIVAEFPVAS